MYYMYKKMWNVERRNFRTQSTSLMGLFFVFQDFKILRFFLGSIYSTDTVDSTAQVWERLENRGEEEEETKETEREAEPSRNKIRSSAI